MKIGFIFVCFLFVLSQASAAVTIDFSLAGPADVSIADARGAADIYFDSHDAAVVGIASGLLAADVERVTGRRPAVQNDFTKLSSNAILIGTIGQSAVIDQLISAGKLDVTGVRGQWEAFVWQTIEDPLPGVHRALVIAGSDRRGTAYGVLELSKQIGVSPWYWWADVPATKHDQLRASAGRSPIVSPAVKYRGIFLNDEDFGLRPWASKTFDPQTGNLGPKTYARIFELLLRLRMNYIWPAMHPGSAEFSTFPGNAQTADQWAIVTGSSHCEPMLRNNVYWPKSSGAWRYDQNRDAIFNYWKESATNRGNFESVWTLGIRGIHDAPMSGPKEPSARVKMVEQIFTDQRSLIDQFVTHQYGPPAECFVPYKEVLPLYDSGMKVPDDVTLVWPDDNYGYVRRLGTAKERERSGGSGVYYHLSYWGAPHSYLWVESTAPGLMWEELNKAYDNDSKTIWVVNVGDLKPAEVCIDFFSRLAWNPAAWNADAQTQFLRAFDADMFGSASAKVLELQTAYYALASVRKPEHIDYAWIDSLSAPDRKTLQGRYEKLLAVEQQAAEALSTDRADAYFETVGYAARMLGATGLLYLGDDETARHWKQYIDQQSNIYNDQIAGGKWHLMMSTTPEGVEWPEVVGGKAKPVARAPLSPAVTDSVLRDAAEFNRSKPATNASWQSVAGLGWSGRAVTILPAIPSSAWDLGHLSDAPELEYDFDLREPTDGKILLHALPTLRLSLGGALRVAVGIDDQAPTAIDVPGGKSDNELGKERRAGVLANRVTIAVATGPLAAGTHHLKIYAVDPGLVLDQIELPPPAH
jgi:hypothetical protein